MSSSSLIQQYGSRLYLYCGEGSTEVSCICLPSPPSYRLKKGLKAPSMYHTVTSAQGAYQQWQVGVGVVGPEVAGRCGGGRSVG